MLERVKRSVALGLTSAALGLLALSLSPVPVPAAWSADREPLQAGIELYNRKDYQGAVHHFEKALQRNAQSAPVHYYYANCMAFLKRSPEALAHYLRCYQIDPESSYGVYSALALKTHELHKRRNLALAPASGFELNGTRIGPGRGEGSAQDLDRAISIIKYQGATAQNNSLQQSAARARDNLKRGEYRAIDLQRESEAVRDMMRGARLIDGSNVRRYSEHEIDAVTRRYERRINDARARAAAEAQYEEQESVKHVSAVDSDIANLEQQLVDDRSRTPSSPHLQAVGTNLYVRMYAPPRFIPSTAPQEELVATQERLVLEKHSKPGTRRTHVEPTEAVADQGKLVIEGGKGTPAAPNLKVSGRVLHVH